MLVNGSLILFISSSWDSKSLKRLDHVLIFEGDSVSSAQLISRSLFGSLMIQKRNSILKKTSSWTNVWSIHLCQKSEWVIFYESLIKLNISTSLSSCKFFKYFFSTSKQSIIIWSLFVFGFAFGRVSFIFHNFFNKRSTDRPCLSSIQTILPESEAVDLDLFHLGISSL